MPRKPSPIDGKIKSTPNGVRLDLERIYVYPDGHGNLIFKDGPVTNWPFNDLAEAIEMIVGDILRPMHKAAKSQAS